MQIFLKVYSQNANKKNNEISCAKLHTPVVELNRNIYWKFITKIKHLKVTTKIEQTLKYKNQSNILTFKKSYQIKLKQISSKENKTLFIKKKKKKKNKRERTKKRYWEEVMRPKQLWSNW